MQQKENDSSTLAEQSLEHDNKGLTFEDKYVILQVKNQKLKRQIRTLGEAFSYWREQALHYRAICDHYRVQAQERAGEKT